MLSLHDCTYLLDMEGNRLASVHKKLVSLHETHYIEIGGEEATQVRSQWFHPIHPKIDVPGFGWQIQGNFWELDFTVVDREGEVRMSVHRKMFSLGEGYQVAIGRDEDVIRGLALMVALERMMTERKERTANSTSHAAQTPPDGGK